MTILAEPAGPSGAGRFKWPRRNTCSLAYRLMFIYVLWTTENFLINAKDPEWAHIEPFKWILLPHGLVAACALFLGPLQFSDRLRARYAKVHRIVGRIYVTGVLIGAPLGIYIPVLRGTLWRLAQLHHRRRGGRGDLDILHPDGAFLHPAGKVQQHRHG